jgi:hypothetical protein
VDAAGNLAATARQVADKTEDLRDYAGCNPCNGHSVAGWPETVLPCGEVIAEGGQRRAAPGTGHPPAPEVRLIESPP